MMCGDLEFWGQFSSLGNETNRALYPHWPAYHAKDLTEMGGSWLSAGKQVRSLHEWARCFFCWKVNNLHDFLLKVSAEKSLNKKIFFDYLGNYVKPYSFKEIDSFTLKRYVKKASEINKDIWS